MNLVTSSPIIVLTLNFVLLFVIFIAIVTVVVVPVVHVLWAKKITIGSPIARSVEY